MNSSATKANDGNDAGDYKSYNGTHHVVIAGNIVTGHGIDAIKVAGDSYAYIVAGNTVNGDILESGFDFVGVHDLMTLAYNIIKGTTGMSSATLGKDGADNVEVYGNEFISTGGKAVILIGGHGGS